jgi:hypothetical protein
MGSAAPSSFSVQRLDGGSAVTLTLLRARCLDMAGKHDLTAAFEALSQDTDARAVIIASGHPQALLVDVGELASRGHPVMAWRLGPSQRQWRDHVFAKRTKEDRGPATR